MYLLSQLWWFLLLAFLLGALLGYLLWRACGRRRIETHYERSNKELVSRLGSLEQERTRFTGAAVDAEGDNAKLKVEVANLQGKLADTSSRLNAAVDAADGKLKSYVDNVRHREETMSAEIEKLRKESDDARKGWDAEKAAAKVREDKLAMNAVQVKKSADDAQRKHADDLRAAEKRLADETQKKHAEELKKAQDNACIELAALHTADLKKVQDQVKHSEANVLALTQADTGARKELEDVKTRHAAELKKARDEAVGEVQAKHAEEIKRARDHVKAELVARHAAELKKVREEVAADAARKHAEDLKKAREQAAAEAQAKHAEELEKARDQVRAELSSSHAAEIKKA